MIYGRSSVTISRICVIWFGASIVEIYFQFRSLDLKMPTRVMDVTALMRTLAVAGWLRVEDSFWCLVAVKLANGR